MIMRGLSLDRAAGLVITFVILLAVLGMAGATAPTRDVAAPLDCAQRCTSPLIPGYRPLSTSTRIVTSRQELPRQYVRDKLHLAAAHRLARGKDVSIAVIDSGVDGAHPDLSGAVLNKYDTTGTVGYDPHPHGTGMAGAIVARHKLLGVAPGANIVAIRAFTTRSVDAEITTHNILKALNWAANNSVRIVNMSFAGPRDASLERALKMAHDKGIVLIAAAGNFGPDAAPLFPAANPHVIAVTATDKQDRLFADANRGAHVAIAAPGVNILLPAPNAQYQIATGTSAAAALVSGVVALMLERNPKLTPADVRQILSASARRLGPANQFGAGLVDPLRALQLATADGYGR